jgi:hypothetical protein
MNREAHVQLLREQYTALFHILGMAPTRGRYYWETAARYQQLQSFCLRGTQITRIGTLNLDEIFGSVKDCVLVTKVESPKGWRVYPIGSPSSFLRIALYCDDVVVENHSVEVRLYLLTPDDRVLEVVVVSELE